MTVRPARPARRDAAAPPSSGRADEVAHGCRRVAAWAAEEPDVAAVGLAGSWARGAARADSDVDLVVLTGTPERWVAGEDWIAAAVGRPVTPVRTRTWGVLTERRVRLRTGLEVELGIVPERWAAEPVDGGTARVVRDGFRVLHDPDGVLARLVAVLGGARES